MAANYQKSCPIDFQRELQQKYNFLLTLLM
jgi:hypothetical protein